MCPTANLEMQIVLEYITNIGWSLVTVIVAGQLMVAITDDGLPIIPSIIIVSTMCTHAAQYIDWFASLGCLDSTRDFNLRLQYDTHLHKICLDRQLPGPYRFHNNCLSSLRRQLARPRQWSVTSRKCAFIHGCHLRICVRIHTCCFRLLLQVPSKSDQYHHLWTQNI